MIDARQDRTGALSRQRRADVVTAATRLFSELGYHATSLREIADRSGIEKGHLYYYFHSKADILYEIMSDLQAVFIEGLEAVDRKGEPPSAALGDLFYRHVVILGSHIDAAVVSYENLRMLDDDRRARLVEDRDRYENGLASIIDRARTTMDIAEAPTELLTKVALGVVNWPYRWMRPRDGDSLDELATLLAERAVASILR